MNDISTINLFLEAGLVVKSVMAILLLISLFSWIIIFERYFLYRKIKSLNIEFENKFWSGEDLNNLFDEAAYDFAVASAFHDDAHYGLANVYPLPERNFFFDLGYTF